MVHQLHEHVASLARWENEGGAMRPHLRLIRRLPLRPFNKFNMWNFGGIVDGDDAVTWPSVKRLHKQALRRIRPRFMPKPLAAGRWPLPAASSLASKSSSPVSAEGRCRSIGS
jgi:hypothetical protein